MVVCGDFLFFCFGGICEWDFCVGWFFFKELEFSEYGKCMNGLFFVGVFYCWFDFLLGGFRMLCGCLFVRVFLI